MAVKKKKKKNPPKAHTGGSIYNQVKKINKQSSCEYLACVSVPIETKAPVSRVVQGAFHTPFIFMFVSRERHRGGLRDVSRRSPPTSQLCRQHQRWARGGSTSLAGREVWNCEDVSCERAAGKGDVETSNGVNMQRLAETLERQLWTEEAAEFRDAADAPSGGGGGNPPARGGASW